MIKFLLSASLFIFKLSSALSCSGLQDDNSNTTAASVSSSACFDSGDFAGAATRYQLCNAQSDNVGHTQQQEANTDIISLLPGELLVQVASTLSGKDILQLAATCYRLNQSLQENVFWQPLIQEIRDDFEPMMVDNKTAREIYTIHHLKVRATALEDPKLMTAFIQKHHLFQYPTFFLGRFFFNHQYCTHFDSAKFTATLSAQEHARIEHQLQNLFITSSTVMPESEQIIIHRQLNGLIHGNYGYARDLARATALIELRCQQGDDQAVDLKLCSFIYGHYGYAKTLAEKHDLIEQWSAQGHPLAVKLKIWGLNGGCYGYSKNLEHLRNFIDYWSMQGCRTAFSRKINGLLYERYGYTQDLREAHRLIEDGIIHGQVQAVHLKLIGLTLRECGYIEVLSDVRAFIDHWSAQRNREAMYRKMEGLMYGDYGYVQDLQAVHDLIESWSAQGYPDFINKKISGLITGKYGYAQDLEAAGRFIMTLPTQTVRDRIEHVLCENFRFTDFSHLNDFIDVLHQQGQRYGTYLKAFFLKFPLSPDQDSARAAKEFILQHRIAF